MKRPAPTPIEAFLAPLADLAKRQPEIEALVFWGHPEGWPEGWPEGGDDTPTEALESEEIVFYAEGLLEDGFHMVWTVVALPETPGLPDHARLQFWQDGAPPPTAAPPGCLVLATDRWTPA